MNTFPVATNLNELSKLKRKNAYIIGGIGVISTDFNAPIVLVDNTLPQVTSDYLEKQNFKTINIHGL